MKRLICVLTLPAAVYAASLSELIDRALESNQMVKASEYVMLSRARERDAARSDYYPTIDVGAAYETLDRHISFQPGNRLSIYAKAGVDLFDGFRKKRTLQQKKSDFEASRYELAHAKKVLVRDVVHDFFTVRSMQASLRALEQKGEQLQADINRVRHFKKAGMVPQEYVDKLQAAYDANGYAIASLKLALRRMQAYLALKTGLSFRRIGAGSIKDPGLLAFQPSDALEAMQQQARVLGAAARALDSVYYPNVRLEDTYSNNRYGRDDGLRRMGIEPIEKQNRLQLAARMRLFDRGSMKQKKDALKLQRAALLERIAFRLKEEKISWQMAASALDTARAKIKSAKSARRAARSVYRSMKAKFSAGMVDQVTYLDALSKMSEAEARYETAKNDYETAKADYCFAANRDIREFVQ